MMAGPAPLSPGAGAGSFLSPHETDHLEELLLDVDGNWAASPTTALARTLDTEAAATTADARPRGLADTRASSASNSTHSLANAVHMEVQENAKLPTFNLPVDRSNASWHVPARRGRRAQTASRRGARNRSLSISSGDSGSLSSGQVNPSTTNVAAAPVAAPVAASLAAPHSPLPKLRPQHIDDTYPGTSEHGPMDAATSQAIDDILKFHEHDMNLSEMFLDGHDRSSAALAYSYSHSPAPIPKPQDKPLNAANSAAGALAPRTGFVPQQSILYNRRAPLPIPTLKKQSPPRNQVAAAAALATAAAIATRTSPTDGMTAGAMDKQTAAALSVQPNIMAPPPVAGRMPPGPPQLAPRTTPPRTALKPTPKDAPAPAASPKAPGAAAHAHPTRPAGPPGAQLPGPHPITAAPKPAAMAAPKVAPTALPKPTQPTPTSAPKPGHPLHLAGPPATAARPAGQPAARAAGPPPIPSAKRSVAARPTAPVPPGYPYAAQAQARARQLAAHAKTKASIAHATVQRSKYGFGGDHKVPSVPSLPPSVRGYKAGAPVAAGRKVPLATAGAAGYTATDTHAQSTTNMPTVIAYERKKQRAKNARVKLNEAIEELAVAIDLAGSQSKERFNYVTKTTGTNSGHMTNGQPPSGPPQHPLARLMDETIQQASNAKKWDRPAFVGLSASIIHSLNAQCEGLMREVAQLRKLAMSPDAVASSSATMAVAPTMVQSASANSNGVPSPQNSTRGVPPGLPEHAAKKQKLGPGINAATLAPSGASNVMKDQELRLVKRYTVESPNILKTIASFLDPSSLTRCLGVSKRWKGQRIFQNHDLWLDMCIKRFGASAVRKWQDADGDLDRRKKNTRPNLDLYRLMGANNVKPYCPKGEGSLFMGASSLPEGFVSCWVTLMDRSNGETSRSVMQNKGTGDKTEQCYKSMPVVELRLLVQNTGFSKGAIVIPDQSFAVDASTRRKGEKMLEVEGDDRFKRQVLHTNRTPSLDGKPASEHDKSLGDEMCHLRLFEMAVISVHIHARGCSTTTKFCHRSKRTQLLVSIDGTTRPLSIPFNSINDHQIKQSFH